MNVNDGGGLYNTDGMFDSIIVDCDGLLKKLFDGQRVAFCGGVVELIQKLGALKEGVVKELSDKDKRIEELEEERSGECAAGSVHNTLDGTVGSGEERLQDVIFAEGGGLEPDPDHVGA